MFRTHDPDGERLVAVKAFAIDLTPEQAADLAAILDRLRFLDVPGTAVARILGAGVEDSVAFLAQQYVAGESLDAAVRQYGPAPPADAVRLISHVAAALDGAAAVGLFHGALHPRDILVTPGETHVTGLGVAAALEAVGHRAPIRRPYAAPEREGGGEWGAASDIYALAAVSYEVLTARRALPGTEHPLPGLSDVKAHDVEALHEAIMTGLDPAPDRRPSSALAFAAAFGAALTGPVRGVGVERSGRQKRTRARAARLPGLEDPLLAGVGAGATLAPEIEQSISIREPQAPLPIPGDASPAQDSGIEAASVETSASVPLTAGAQREGDLTPTDENDDRPYAHPSAGGDADPEVERDAEAIVAPEVEIDAETHADPGVEPELEHETLPGVEPEARPEIEEDVAAGVESEAVFSGDVAIEAALAASLGAELRPEVDSDSSDPEAEPGGRVLASAGAAATESGPDALPNAEIATVSGSADADDGELTPAQPSPPTTGEDASEAAERAEVLPAESDDNEFEGTLGEVLESSVLLQAPEQLEAAVADAGAGSSATHDLDDPAEHRAHLPTQPELDLADLSVTFTPEASDLNRAGFAPDLDALSRALDGARSEDQPRPGGMPDEAAAVAHPLSASRLVADSRDESEKTHPAGEQDDRWLVDRPSAMAAETIDDFRDPGSLVAEPPVPRALDLTDPGRPLRHPASPSASAGEWRRGYVIAAGIALAVLILALVAYWTGAFQPRIGGADSVAPPNAGVGVPVEAPTAVPAGAAGGSPASPAGEPPPAGPVPAPPPAGEVPAPPPAGEAPAAAPLLGEIRVTSTPSRADVFVNGERRGVTPRTLRDLPLGTYSIRVSRPGYSSQDQVVTISPDQPIDRVAFSLAPLRQAAPVAVPAPGRPSTKPTPAPSRPADRSAKPAVPTRGSISVETRPGGVRVFIDGRAVGLSPLVVPDVSPGTHEVRLELQGYRPWVTKITLKPGERFRVTASLERAPSR